MVFFGVVRIVYLSIMKDTFRDWVRRCRVNSNQ